MCIRDRVTSLTEKGGEELAGILKALAEKTEEGREEHTILIGPAPAFIGRINDIFRYVLYIKNPDYDILIRLKNRMERFLKEQERKDENVQFDFCLLYTSGKQWMQDPDYIYF